jgi:hypothetical protein
MTRIGID